ncbi:MAG: aminomethyl-transferring glycine dehydrogenase subunit GcvPB [Chloroflexota bacterium]
MTTPPPIMVERPRAAGGARPPAPLVSPVEPTIFERSVPGRAAYVAPPADVPERPLDELIPASYCRATPPDLPELSELQVVRHFTRLSQKNYSIDSGFYPLGSCTMKYNPKLHEKAAALPGFAALHPHQHEETAQGTLRLLYDLGRYLCAIGGMDEFTLQPAAGAHGELVGMMIARAYHTKRGEIAQRREVLVPDSAHGTNPASAVAAGFEVVTVPSSREGRVDLEALRTRVGPRTAALMLTNPNTCGLFERDIVEIARIIHEAGGLLYYDGANLNAIMGTVRPGDMGFDIVHFNLHKTMTTPHGGGGPGTGPVGVKAGLAPFLPVPIIEKSGAAGDEHYRLSYDRSDTIGRSRSFYGNVGLLVRAYTYVRTMGGEGLRQASRDAVLNANYLRTRVQSAFETPFAGPCMHEFVLSGRRQRRLGVRTLDMAKRLIDYGYHPPTMYFPLIVDECLMIEPTETEDRETLDAFAEALLAVAREAEEDRETVLAAPVTTPVGRVDEARAARKPDLRWRPERA